MGDTTRFGVSMDSQLLEMLDALTAERGFGNRSDALRCIVRDQLKAGERERGAGPSIAFVSLCYRNELRLPANPLKPYPSLKMLANLQLHLDDELCMKVLVLKGLPGELRSWAQKLISHRGVTGTVSMAGDMETMKKLSS